MKKQIFLATTCGVALLIGCGTKEVQSPNTLPPQSSATTITGHQPVKNAQVTPPTSTVAVHSILDTIPPVPRNRKVNDWQHMPLEVDPKNNVVLTFDDGPSPWTIQLVQTLDHENVPAVFFWNTYHIQYANTSVVQMLRNSPNISVGDHTVDHPNLLNLRYSTQYKEINDDKMAVQQRLGEPVYFFRPPFGNYNATTEQVLNNTGLTNVMWDDDSLDWKYNTDEAAILRTIQIELHPGAVILLHDHEHTIKFLPDIIALIRRDGYGFTTFKTPSATHSSKMDETSVAQPSDSMNAHSPEAHAKPVSTTSRPVQIGNPKSPTK